MGKLWRRAYTVLNNPVAFGTQFIQELYYDYLALTGRVSYSNHLIFVAGLPKSGTSWLEKIISEVPGYIKLNGSFLRRFRGAELLSYSHGVNAEMLASAPRGKYSFLKLHTHYRDEYIAILEQANIKPVVLIRDLRDMMISRYYHILSDPTHWFYNDINGLPFDEGFEKSLFGVSEEDTETAIKYYKSWVDGWVNYVNMNREKALLVRYEDMKTDLCQTMDNILRFHDISLSRESIDRMIRRQSRNDKVKESLAKNLSLPGKFKSTFRKGSIGEWKNCFTERHVDIFKREAGDTLITSGYEEDYNWDK